MSLKVRLILSIAISFLLALSLGGALATWRARQSVRTEMNAALQGGADLVADTSRNHPSDLERTVRSFDGMRHLRMTLRNQAEQIVAVSKLAPPAHEAPAWFANPIAPAISSLRITGLPLPDGWSLTLTTDSRNEIAEVWAQTRDAFAALIVFCSGTGVLAYLLVGRSLRFLTGFGQALGRVADGNYDTKLDEKGPPEFARLAGGYNRMALRLSQYEQENKILQRQIVEIQEEERAEIARDLHDEVGPLLFSINVDATAIPQLARSGSLNDLTERTNRIHEAASRIQHTVKSILRQLKPVDVLDFGLKVAIRELISFWQTRMPDLKFEFRAALEGTNLERTREEVVYRVVQESLSNAIRHGKPKSVVVSVSETSSREITVTISDDGSGLPYPRPARGAGLNGMAERVQGLGGKLVVENNEAGGVRVSAILPLATVAPGLERDVA